MEGPSLVIAAEEFSVFIGKKLKNVRGTAALPFKNLQGLSLTRVDSWGKHLIITVGNIVVRVHFLMFGSYRIDKPRENRIPKWQFDIGESEIFFYSCAIKVMEESPADVYDWSIDVMSKRWDSRKALRHLKKLPTAKVCDVLMDQSIFAGVGNIIKNEVLFLEKLHPEVQLQNLTEVQLKKLVSSTRAYCLQFYRWKKINQLKRNWKIFRKEKCPLCLGPVTKKKTGKLDRVSHFCNHCQYKAVV